MKINLNLFVSLSFSVKFIEVQFTYSKNYSFSLQFCDLRQMHNHGTTIIKIQSIFIILPSKFSFLCSQPHPSIPVHGFFHLAWYIWDSSTLFHLFVVLLLFILLSCVHWLDIFISCLPIYQMKDIWAIFYLPFLTCQSMGKYSMVMVT